MSWRHMALVLRKEDLISGGEISSHRSTHYAAEAKGRDKTLHSHEGHLHSLGTSNAIRNLSNQ
jgi:hypothetical protein